MCLIFFVCSFCGYFWMGVNYPADMDITTRPTKPTLLHPHQSILSNAYFHIIYQETLRASQNLISWPTNSISRWTFELLLISWIQLYVDDQSILVIYPRLNYFCNFDRLRIFSRKYPLYFNNCLWIVVS